MKYNRLTPKEDNSIMSRPKPKNRRSIFNLGIDIGTHDTEATCSTCKSFSMLLVQLPDNVQQLLEQAREDGIRSSFRQLHNVLCEAKKEKMKTGSQCNHIKNVIERPGRRVSTRMELVYIHAVV